MEFLYSKNDAIEIRTKHIVNKFKSLSIVVFIVLSIIILPSNASQSPIDFDDVESSLWKNATVTLLPTIRNSNSNTVPLLKIQGLTAFDTEDDIILKPTFSETDCTGDESDLQIVNDVFFVNGIAQTNDLIVALNNFDFKQHKAAYLCIKTKYDSYFLHMGIKSKFTK